MTDQSAMAILGGVASGSVIATTEPLSFWGGIDPATGCIIDVHHPLHGTCITGAILMMPTTRGSCTGSGVLLDLALTGRAPAALVFSQAEDVVTLGALIAAEMFSRKLPVLRLSQAAFDALAGKAEATITESEIRAEGLSISIDAQEQTALTLTDRDRALLSGEKGKAAQQAMRILCAMASNQGASELIDVSQAHIDGCIYASPANLTFADAMADLGAKVMVPTTMNAISVDYDHWQAQGVAADFGGPASRLADAYVRMGCRPTYTCSPYLLDTAPKQGEVIGWSESNAVIFANSVLGARTAKHPDFLDLCIAMTGRTPNAGVYLDAHRKAQTILDVEMPDRVDDAFWPLIGYLAGKASPNAIPLLRGLAAGKPERDDLKALCAAFGTSSAAPMLHIEGVTPEATNSAAPSAERVAITKADMREAWLRLTAGPEKVDLIAIGSPHASLTECARLADALAGRRCLPDVPIIVTAGADVMRQAEANGIPAQLAASGVKVIPDLCWCSIVEPVFPPSAKVVMTNSGKYAHYGPGLSGRTVRFGSLADCVSAALTGKAGHQLPSWLR